MDSLRAILAPRSVAVVGVSSRAESLSLRLLANMTERGYRGAIYPINPRATTIAGLPCYASVGETPGKVDLAVVMVPRDTVGEAISDCLSAGVLGVIVITAGFREGGEAGARAERELLGRLQSSGVRMIGPNCMGIINTAPAVSLDATFSPRRALSGPVAFASHSGALGVAVLEAAGERRLGFSQFVSLGNSADVTVCDLLEVWEEDSATRVIMLYLEAIEEPRRSLSLASRISVHKPIVAMKAGRTEAGARAASSHTGALAAADSAVDALLKQAGVLRAATLEELSDLALALQLCPLSRGRRVAVVTNAGGPAIAATDMLAGSGLELARLAPATEQALRGFLPAEAAVSNPVDMLPSATAANYQRALELVLDDPGVDAAITATVTSPITPPVLIAEALAGVGVGAGKPVLGVFMSSPAFYGEASKLAGVPPVYRFPENAVRALGGLARQGRRQSFAGLQEAPPVVASALLGRLVSGGGHLSPRVAFDVLEEIGIPVARCRVAGNVGEVAGVAAEIGFPLVLKVYGAALVHKSELGAVMVGLRDER
ncbi:MAG: CoA-binding protein, partial [Acidobacteriota bacterium]